MTPEQTRDFANSDVDQFVLQSNKSIQSQVSKYGIETIYLPIDGTRRYFIAKTGMEQGKPEFFNKYFDFVKDELIELLKRVFDLGLKTVIVLLMDKSAFERDMTYLKPAIKHGIEPLVISEKFKTFYSTHRVELGFLGFNEIYRIKGFNDLYNKMMAFNNEKSGEGDFNLYFYTGPTDDEDIFQLIEGRIPNDPLEGHETIYKNLYPFEVGNIDFGIYYGYPRSKTSPIFLSDESIHFYTANPSLSTSSLQLKKAIYYTIQARRSIRDQYLDYSADELDVDLVANDLLGETWYLRY